MTRSNRRKNIVALCALGLTFLAVGTARAAQPSASDPLQLVPAESLFCVRINKLNMTMGQVDQFLTGISPIPINLSMMVQSQFAQILGSPDPNGIIMSGDFAVFGPLPGGEAPNPSRVGILVPVSDYQKFAKGNPNVTAPDAQGISRIGPTDQQPLVAVNVAGYALVTGTDNQQALTEVKTWIPRGATSLAQRLGSDELKRAQSSPVWLYANIQTAHKIFGPALQQKIQEAKEKFKQMQGQGRPMMGQMDSIMDMYATLINTLMQQTQLVSLSLDPTATVLRAGFSMVAVPETEMAKVLTGNTATPDRSFLRFLQNEAVMNLVATVDPASWNRFNDLSINLLAQLAGKPASDEEVRRLRKISADATNAVGGTVAGSFSAAAGSKPPFVLRYVVGLKDAQAFSRALDEMPKIFNSGLVADFYKQMGLKLNVEIQRKAETYKDVAIDSLKFNFAPTDPNSLVGQMVTAIYGQGLDARVGMVNDRLVYAIAADPMPVIRELIDQVKNGGSAQQVPSEFQAAMQLIPGSEKADFFATYNYLRVLQMVATMLPMPIPQTNLKSQSNIALAGNSVNGRLAVQIAIPKQHVQEVMAIFMQMQQKPQEQQKQDQQGQM